MVTKSNFVGRTIPDLSTKKSSPVTTNFAEGMYTYKPNDTMDTDELTLAQDARFDRVGEYGTRLGYKKLCEPIGKGTVSTVAGTKFISANGVADSTVKITSSFTLYSLKITIRRDTSNYVVPKLTVLWGEQEQGISCINISDLAVGSSKEYEAVFASFPRFTAPDSVTVKVGVQSGATTDFSVQVTDTNALAWTMYSATSGEISNVFEANIDGTRTVLFTFNGALYRMAEDGNITKIRTLPTGTAKVRFQQNLNQIRYVDGLEVPHLLDPANSWADSAITVKDLATDVTLDVKMSNIMNGTSDNIVYFAADPDTEALWTYPYGYTFAKSASFTTTATISGSAGTTLSIASSTITPSGIAVGDWITGQGTATAEVTSISGSTVYLKIVDTTPQTISSYDKFGQDFYQNFPAIKTGDPLTAMFNLGGVLYFMTKRNKYQMYAQSADSWSQSASNAQNGTFSQESIVCDLNYAYFANDNGIYIFDGSSEASLTENSIQNLYDAIPDKDQIVLDLFKNRLYVYFPSTKGGVNDSCLVYNINLKVWESVDSKTYVSATSARQNSSSRFICGHSKIGMLMLNEDATDNDYSDMGAPIAFNLETAYQHFGTTSQQKRITKWRPQFAATDQPYTVECGYALDFSEKVEYAFSIDLKEQKTVLTSHVWNNPSDYGIKTLPTIYTTSPKVNGEFMRCQIRYQHIAAFEPVIFRSHTLTIQTQRIR